MKSDIHNNTKCFPFKITFSPYALCLLCLHYTRPQSEPGKLYSPLALRHQAPLYTYPFTSPFVRPILYYIVPRLHRLPLSLNFKSLSIITLVALGLAFYLISLCSIISCFGLKTPDFVSKFNLIL